jgi:hypothetical protein
LQQNEFIGNPLQDDILNKTLRHYATKDEVMGLQANYEPSIILCFIAASIALGVSLFFLKKLTKRVKKLEAELNKHMGENKNGEEQSKTQNNVSG